MRRQLVNYAFVQQEPAQSFRHPAAASKAPFPTKATNPSTASSQRESVTKSRRRTGSLTQSLLEFISRRPFSSSGSDFVRSAPPSALDTGANIKHSTNYSSHLPPSSSSGGTVSTLVAVTALSAQHKRFKSHIVSTAHSTSKPRSPLPRAETHPIPNQCAATNRAPKQTASTPKLRHGLSPVHAQVSIPRVALVRFFRAKAAKRAELVLGRLVRTFTGALIWPRLTFTKITPRAFFTFGHATYRCSGIDSSSITFNFRFHS